MPQTIPWNRANGSVSDVQELLDAAGMGLVEVGPAGDIVWANDGYLALMGLHEEACVGRSLAEFSADEPTVVEDFLLRLSRRERQRNYPVRLKAADGTVRELLISTTPVMVAEGLSFTRCLIVDVTAQKRAASAQSLLASIVDSSDDAIVTKSLNGIVSSWNAGAERLFGYSAAEAVGQPITLIIPPELQHEERDILARLRRGERIDHYETQRITKGGERREISLTISPVLDDEGQIVGASKIARDITERKRVEEELRDSEERLRDAIDLLPAAIYTTDADGVITHFNAAAAALSGQTPNVGIDRWCVSWKLYRPDGTAMPHEQCPMAVALAEERPIHGAEIIVERPDGSRSWAAAYPTPMHDRAGRLVGGINMLVDVTERRRAHERLTESEERYRRLTGLLPVAVYTCEAPSGEISYFNDHAAQLWGRTPELRNPDETFCGSWRLYLPDDTPLPHDQCPMAVAIREGREFRNREVVIERRDGSRITVLVNIAPIRGATGEITGAINVCLDVSPLKRAEQRLKEADRRKDEFLATLSHELRNPLAPLRHALEIIRLSGDDANLVRDSREAMERQVAHMVRLINDLLDMSRVTHDKLTLYKEPVELAAVTRQAIENNSPLIEEAGHQLIVDLPEAPVWLNADAVRMTQVVDNLLSNACKYMEPGGEIRVIAARRGDVVEVSVQDDGQGIPPDNLERIFEMFAQSDRSRERAQAGLGIGLTLVRRLVEMHAGTIHAISEGIGRGSEFVVRLPVIAAPADQQDSPPTPDGSTSSVSRRVLVVDDNVDSARSLASLLEIDGHDAHCAFEGIEAVRLAEQLRPELILLDIGLPRIDGYEVCRRIRSQPWGADIVIIAVTGWGQERDQQASGDAGFNAHLVKPIDYSDLKSALAGLPEKARP